MFRLDYASHSVLAVCSCGWRHLSTNAQNARRAAVMHENIAHPGEYQALKLAGNAAARHATRRRRFNNDENR